jgi:hypothetical protein
MRIASLYTYPVKGCHRLDHDEAGVQPWGLGLGLALLSARPRPGYSPAKVDHEVTVVLPAFRHSSFMINALLPACQRRPLHRQLAIRVEGG